MRLSFYSGLAAAMLAASDTAKASEKDFDENQLAQAEARDIRATSRGWNLAQSASTMESDLGADNDVEANSDVDVDTGSEVTTENEVGTESEVDLDT